MPDSPTVHLAASHGGHVAELQALAGAFEDRSRVWISAESAQADALRAGGERVLTLPPEDPRGPIALLRNARAAAQLVARERPALVVTTGAGVVVPFSLLARVRGARLVFVESMARVSGPSLTGRILAPVAQSVLVQWPEMAGVYRRAVACRPAVLDALAGAEAPAGRGTFVSVGTRPEPFDRLLRIVDRAVGDGVLPGPVIAQSGGSAYAPENYSIVSALPPAAVQGAIRDSRYVVCHAGAGIISSALLAGRKPLVLPRSARAGEHRTEHQHELAARLAARGAVVGIGERIEASDLAAAASPAEPPRGDLPTLESALRAELDPGHGSGA